MTFDTTQQEIAKKLNCSQQAIYDDLRRGYRKFKKEWIKLHGEFDTTDTDWDKEQSLPKLPNCKQLSFLL